MVQGQTEARKVEQVRHRHLESVGFQGQRAGFEVEGAAHVVRRRGQELFMAGEHDHSVGRHGDGPAEFTGPELEQVDDDPRIDKDDQRLRAVDQRAVDGGGDIANQEAVDVGSIAEQGDAADGDRIPIRHGEEHDLNVIRFRDGSIRRRRSEEGNVAGRNADQALDFEFDVGDRDRVEFQFYGEADERGGIAARGFDAQREPNFRFGTAPDRALENAGGLQQRSVRREDQRAGQCQARIHRMIRAHDHPQLTGHRSGEDTGNEGAEGQLSAERGIGHAEVLDAQREGWNVERTKFAVLEDHAEAEEVVAGPEGGQANRVGQADLRRVARVQHDVEAEAAQQIEIEVAFHGQEEFV